MPTPNIYTVHTVNYIQVKYVDSIEQCLVNGTETSG